ncbi:right-handed parallel beta-helix repeat-containing protein [Maribacter sp. X9]|uniref:right-handed parallel beta-helix repeat-containing protein n=1 Tax=Maribacter sp. X9 TaxID=3402159 RepID=UPI003AF38442
MRFKILIIFPLLLGLLWTTACRKDFEYAPSAGNLSFSKDTVYLDTVFASIGSSTYTLKVYNNTRDDILIPSISLKNGPESFYRLNVDGVAGKSFTNIPIYARDSLFILIETTIEITESSVKELLYTDVIQFDTEPYQQQVELVTLAKDAIFLFPDSGQDYIKESVLLYTDSAGNEITVTGFEVKDEDLKFTNEKPYVIYGYGIIPSGKEFQIDAGARVFFHKDSGIIVKDAASIKVNGKLSSDEELLKGEVIFEGDRLEPSFAELPGQWGALWITKGSTDNYLEHITIKNADIGLFVEGASDIPTNTLTIKDSQIYNNSSHNIWARNANVIAENLVLGGSGSSSLNCENGGSYSFTHCTIANYWNKGFRTKAALEISNTSSDSRTSGSELAKADFKNCIIDGNNQNEISILVNEAIGFDFSFQNCLIKSIEDQTTIEGLNLYDFDGSAFYSNILLNGKADFFLSAKNDFRIGEESEAINLGDKTVATAVPFDLSGLLRTVAPDLGAYQIKAREE